MIDSREGGHNLFLKKTWLDGGGQYRQLSVLPKSDKMPLTLGDLNRKPPEKGMMKDVIKDSNIISENLRFAGYDDYVNY
jgi:hypothetical protein